VLTVFSLGKKRLGGDVIDTYKYFMGGWKDGARLLMVISHETGEN